MALLFIDITLDIDIACYFGCSKPIIRQACSSHPGVVLTLGDHGSSRKDMWGPGARFLKIFQCFRHFNLKVFWVQSLCFVCVQACFLVTFCTDSES